MERPDFTSQFEVPKNGGRRDSQQDRQGQDIPHGCAKVTGVFAHAVPDRLKGVRTRWPAGAPQQLLGLLHSLNPRVTALERRVGGRDAFEGIKRPACSSLSKADGLSLM